MIRKAERKDVVAIHGLIQELADYEKAPDEVINTPSNLEKDLFDHTLCEAIVAENETGAVVGFALYYTAYSTWKGPCLYLEDFYVQPDYRKSGYGSALFERVIEIAKERKVARMDWQVLEWNQLAIDFYKRYDALLDPEWLNGRFTFKI